MNYTLSAAYAAWLADERKLDTELCVQMGVVSINGCVAFPYVRNEETLFHKLRTLTEPKRMWCEPSGVDQTFLWNIDALSEKPGPRDVLVITEGEIDALSVIQAGFRFVVSMPSGASDRPEGAREKALACLSVGKGDDSYVLPAVAQFRRVCVLTDCDAPGILLRDAIVEIVGPDVCCTAEFPPACKDANKVLQRHGVERLRAMIEGARPVLDDGASDALADARAEPSPDPIGTGIDWIDHHIKLDRPEFMVVAGEPGSGKSAAMHWLLFSMIWKNPWMRLGVFNAEGRRDLLASRARRFWNRRMRAAGKSTGTEVETERVAWIKDHIGTIRPRQDERTTFEWLIRCIEQQALYHGRNTFVIDPFNEITIPRVPGENRTDVIGECIIRLKALSRRLGLIIVVVHHTVPNRDRRSRDEPPSANDIADSANFWRKADHVMLAWRPHKATSNNACLMFEKVKDNGILGREGRAWVRLEDGNFDLVPVSAEEIERQEDIAAAKAEVRKAERKERRQRLVNEFVGKATEARPPSDVASGRDLPEAITMMADGPGQWGSDMLADEGFL